MEVALAVTVTVGGGFNKNGSITCNFYTMKTKILLLLVLFACIGTNGYSQEKSKKELKEEKKLAVQKQTEALIDAKEFVFTGSDAYPTGYRSVNLTSRQNFVKFHPELIESDMPYFGRANSNVAYASSSGGGLKFTGKPEEYTFDKKEKNYQISATVKETGDTYRITLIVQFSGSATLTIISNNRSPISYNGYISAPAAK
jgi:hypothetical protein